MIKPNERFDEKYEIRLANANDIDMIMHFINSEWKSGHILGVNRSFFEFEFLENDGTVNIVVAIDRETKKLEGMVGFLKASHDPECLDIWGCMWKVNKGAMTMLGVELVKRRMLLSGCRNDIGIGCNPNTAIPIYRTILRRKTGKMMHYYRLSQRKDFKIARIAYKPDIKQELSNEQMIQIREFKTVEELKRKYDFSQNKNMVPYKDEWYIEHRFFKHIICKYKVYGIYVDNRVEAFFVTRDQEYEDRIAVRLVDYIGNQKAFGYTWEFWNQLLNVGCYEYVDFYCLGFQREYLENAGFTLKNDNDENVLPNYFYPFEQKNVDIWVNSTSENTLFCKADGDQDRPNRA